MGNYALRDGSIRGRSLPQVRHKLSYSFILLSMIRLLYALLSPDAVIHRRPPDLTYVKWKHGLNRPRIRAFCLSSAVCLRIDPVSRRVKEV